MTMLAGFLGKATKTGGKGRGGEKGKRGGLLIHVSATGGRVRQGKKSALLVAAINRADGTPYNRRTPKE